MVFGIFLLIFFPFLSSFSVYRGGGGGVQDHLSSPWPTYTTVNCFTKGTSLTTKYIFTLIFTLRNKIIWKLCNIWYEWNFLHIVFFLVCHINGNSFAIALVFNSIHLCQMRKLLQFDEYDRSIRNLVPELFLQHIALI